MKKFIILVHKIFNIIINFCKKYIIDSRETADHSLPYCIAAAVVNRELRPQQFSFEAINVVQILANVLMVKAKLDPEFETRFPAEQPCKVVIKTTNGDQLTKERSYPKGDPRDQLSTEELKRKFNVLADGILNEEQQENIFEVIQNIENVEKIGDLMSLLVK